MNEWRQLLDQTNYKSTTQASTLDIEGLEEESLHEVPADNIQSQNIHPSQSIENDTGAELEWISPTVKLQEKIENIPDKFGFKIGEAADYVGVKQYVLRYWESEFDGLKPKKSKNGQRMYTKRDVETALLIQKLLHEDRFSIEGARSALKRLKKQVRDVGKVQKQASVEVTPVMAKEALRQTASRQENTLPEAIKVSAQVLLEAIQRAKLNLPLDI